MFELGKISGRLSGAQPLTAGRLRGVSTTSEQTKEQTKANNLEIDSLNLALAHTCELDYRHQCVPLVNNVSPSKAAATEQQRQQRAAMTTRGSSNRQQQMAGKQ